MPNHGPAVSRWRSLHGRFIQAARAAYLGVERTPLAPLLQSRWIQRLKARVTYMPAGLVLTLLDRIGAAGTRVWVGGGWGVDALAGQQTRRHYDLDLLIDSEPTAYAAVAGALTTEGFRLGTVQHNAGLAMPLRYIWRHDGGYVVEVLPVVLTAAPFGVTWPAFAEGTIEGRAVPCLSADLQLKLHTGYPQRDIDATDTDLLRAISAAQDGHG
jgi:lincosamide nucleotidyltransferase A/C/D/E